MTPTRRLAAILAADVAGYSRLVGADEDGTLARLRGLFRDVVQPTVVAHRGRVFKLMGDAFLAVFPSAVEAVRCAATLQEAVERRGAGEVPERRIRLRVGVHLGEAAAEGGVVGGAAARGRGEVAQEALEAAAQGHGQTMLTTRETMPCFGLPSGPGET